jgi:hypothetical protein
MAAFRERFNGHVTKAYVSDSNQFMVAYWSVYGDFSATLYITNFVVHSETLYYRLSSIKNMATVDLQMVWKDAAATTSIYYPVICLVGESKITTDLSQ